MTTKFNKNSEIIKIGFNNLWPTVVMLEEIDQSVSVDVYNELMSITEFNKNNNLEENNLFDLDSEIFKDFKNNVVIPSFKQYISKIFFADLDKDFSSYKLKSWISKFVEGHGVSLHNHSGSHLTGTFYLMSEEHDKGGRIEFLDPRTNANRGYPRILGNQFLDIVHQPKTGDILIFPSFLYHHVHTYYSNNRFCLAVDLTLYEHDD